MAYWYRMPSLSSCKMVRMGDCSPPGNPLVGIRDLWLIRPVNLAIRSPICTNLGAFIYGQTWGAERIVAHDHGGISCVMVQVLPGVIIRYEDRLIYHKSKHVTRLGRQCQMPATIEGSNRTGCITKT